MGIILSTKIDTLHYACGNCFLLSVKLQNHRTRLSHVYLYGVVIRMSESAPALVLHPFSVLMRLSPNLMADYVSMLAVNIESGHTMAFDVTLLSRRSVQE